MITAAYLNCVQIAAGVGRMAKAIARANPPKKTCLLKQNFLGHNSQDSNLRVFSDGNHMRKNFLSIVLGVVMMGCIAGCSGITPEPAVAIEDVKSALSQEREAGPYAMRIMTKVDYVDGKNNKRVVGQDLVLSSQMPQDMRITISAFDKAISTLVTDGKVFALMDVSQNVYLAGMATPDNISQILPVALSAADLYRVIHGGFPVDDLADGALENAVIQWDGKEGGYCKSMKTRDGGIQNVYYAYPSWDVFKITVNHEDKTTYVYEASDFKTYKQDNKAFRYLKQIIFRLPQEDTNVRLRVEKCDLDVQFSAAVFRLMPVQGARIIILDNLGETTENSNSGADADNSEEPISSENAESEQDVLDETTAEQADDNASSESQNNDAT